MSATYTPVAGFSRFNLAQIQLRPGEEDKTKNLDHARDLIVQAAAGGGDDSRKADLIILPEYFNSPIANSAHKKHAEEVPDVPAGGKIEKKDLPAASPTLKMLSDAAIQTGIYIIGGSIPERDLTDDTKVYNTMTVWDPQGRMIGKYRKMHLYDVDIPGGITMRESDVISPGSEPTVMKFPFGTVAVAICFDIRFQFLIASLREANPDICAYLLPAAFNLTTGPKAWEILQRARAIDNQIYVGMCSPARKQGEEYVAYGHTLLCDCEGKIISTPTPEDEGETIVYSTLDPEHLSAIRKGVPTLTAQRRDVYNLPSFK
ncbi:carbon-nitrogen hydrolase [Naematelia encephala]|uniref:Carbon-nitrogen hydrolase n=1 Tax=Naematelia encephala TaxID=71784 RepID=A0A1Y2BEC8_9TREE|nr:carbon-nitrogen hydrolase [Naematelia encephala]